MITWNELHSNPDFDGCLGDFYDGRGCVFGAGRPLALSVEDLMSLYPDSPFRVHMVEASTAVFTPTLPHTMVRAAHALYLLNPIEFGVLCAHVSEHKIPAEEAFWMVQHTIREICENGENQ